MKKLYSLCALLLSLNAFGASMPMPPEFKGPIAFSSDAPDKKAFNGAKRIGDSPYYYNQTKGGSLFLGLLGPIGLITNAALVDDKRSKEAGSEGLKQNIDLYKLVQSSLESAQQAEGPSSATVQPFVLMHPDDNEQIMTSLVYVVTVKNGSGTQWQEKYYYHLSRKFYKADVLSAANGEFQEYLIANIPKAVIALSGFVVTDLSAAIPSASQVQVKSAYLGWMPAPFNSVLLTSDDGVSKVRVSANDAFENMYARGMHIFDNTDAEIK